MAINRKSPFHTSQVFGTLTALPSLTYTYHPQMTLDTLGSYVTGTTYDAAGRITNRNLGNGTAIANTYNPWTLQGGRLANILAVQSGITRQSLGYTYDVMGNITQIADGLGLTTNYTNDALNRLDTTTESSKNNPEYDALTGNLANLNGTNPSTQYGYNDPEHLHAVTHIGGILKYMYDANGNMTQRPNQTLQYNPENQLTAVTGTPSASFVYDGDGNRVLSTINGVTTAYIGNHTEWNVTAQEMTRYYLAGSQRVAFRIIKSGQPDRLYYLLSDHLGSSNVVMQVGGGVETQTYSAWGELRTGGISSTKRQYTGQINESSLGLYFYNARYYDAALGRFIQADTIVPFESLGVQAYDRYAYTNNNPIRYVDPTGHTVAEDTEGGCGLPNCIISLDPPFDPSIGGNNESSKEEEKASETSEKRPSLVVLIAIGLPLTGAIVLTELGLTGAEIAIGAATIAQPELTLLTLPLELILMSASLAVGDLLASYLVYTYRVATVPKNEDVKFELLPPWGLK